MSLNANALAALIKQKRLAVTGKFAPVDGPDLDADCAAIAEAVVEHLRAAATVTVAAGIPITGTGGGAAPVAGATTAPGTGTIS